MDLGKHSLISRDQQELQPLTVTLGKTSPASLSRGSIPNTPAAAANSLWSTSAHLTWEQEGASTAK